MAAGVIHPAAAVLASIFPRRRTMIAFIKYGYGRAQKYHSGEEC
jgi:hypothetical protein